MFNILKKSKYNFSRAGEVITNHGKFQTPVFMPPATKAAVKALSPQDLQEIGIEIILVNALHLHLRPTEELINSFGGIHNYMGWPKTILSDSGGFQGWSFSQKRYSAKLGVLSKVTDKGIEFISPYDGSKHFIDAEKAIEIQFKIGSDIIMAFDDCSPNLDNKNYVKLSLERTKKWALKSLKRFQELKKMAPENNTLIFGIVQGGSFLDLRLEALNFITSLPFDGLALGGETIGYDMPRTLEILDALRSSIPYDKPLYTMGLGASPYDIIEVIKRGVDMFDCVSPARLARHGALYNGRLVIGDNPSGSDISFESEYRKGLLKISNSCFAADKFPIDHECNCYTCQNFSRAYLHHLYLIKEPLYFRLATWHNLYFITQLLHRLRENI